MLEKYEARPHLDISQIVHGRCTGEVIIITVPGVSVEIIFALFFLLLLLTAPEGEGITGSEGEWIGELERILANRGSKKEAVGVEKIQIGIFLAHCVCVLADWSDISVVCKLINVCYKTGGRLHSQARPSLSVLVYTAAGPVYSGLYCTVLNTVHHIPS